MKIYRYENSSLMELGGIFHITDYEDYQHKPLIISVVGAGGKSTLLKNLGRDLAERKMKTVLTTTTHMTKVVDYVACNEEELSNNLNEHCLSILAKNLGNEKLAYPGNQLMNYARTVSDVIIVEADGANRHPLKIRAAYEPVYLQDTDIVIIVVGINSLGKKMEDVCHRYNLESMYFEEKLNEIADFDSISRIINTCYIERIKLLFPGKKIIVEINQVDTEEQIKDAIELAGRIENEEVYVTGMQV